MCAVSHALLNKLVTYANLVPGSNLFMQQERRKLEAVVCNPQGPPFWFFTVSPSVRDSPHLMHRLRIGQDAAGVLPAVTSLTRIQRLCALRDNPVDVAVEFEYIRDAYMRHIVEGKRQPLGDMEYTYVRQPSFSVFGLVSRLRCVETVSNCTAFRTSKRYIPPVRKPSVHDSGTINGFDHGTRIGFCEFYGYVKDGNTLSCVTANMRENIRIQLHSHFLLVECRESTPRPIESIAYAIESIPYRRVVFGTNAFNGVQLESTSVWTSTQ